VSPRHLLRLGSLRSIHYDPSTGSINGEKLSRKILTWLHQLRGASGPVVIPWLYDTGLPPSPPVFFGLKSDNQGNDLNVAAALRYNIPRRRWSPPLSGSGIFTSEGGTILISAALKMCRH
jgi:hypothetical protein